MKPPRRPSVIVFGVNETLLDIAVLEPTFLRVFSDRTALREWSAQLVLQSEAITLAGLYAPFAEMALGVLEMVAASRSVALSKADLGELSELLRTMPAHSDAAPALASLKKAGFRLVTLTNSLPSNSPTPLEQAGLSQFLDMSYSVDAVRKFKPAPETYRMVAEAEGVRTTDLCLVACHVWDTIGAQAVGCTAALVKRPGKAVLDMKHIPLPDIVQSNLQDVACEIIKRWRA